MIQFYSKDNELCQGILRTDRNDLSYLDDYKFKKNTYGCMSLFSYLVRTITEHIDDSAFFDICGVRDHESTRLCAHGFLYSFISLAKVLSAMCPDSHISVLLKLDRYSEPVFSLGAEINQEPAPQTVCVPFHRRLGEICGFSVSYEYNGKAISIEYALKKCIIDSAEFCSPIPSTLGLWILAALADADKLLSK